MTAARGASHAISACHPWSLSSSPISWSVGAGTPRSAPVRERHDLGREQADRPGHVHAGRRYRGLRQARGPRGRLRLAAPVQRVVRAHAGRIRDLERGRQQMRIGLLEVGVGDLVAVTGPVGQELDDVPPVQPGRPAAAMRLLVRRYRCQPVVENRQRGPPAKGVQLILGLRVQDDGDGAAVVVRDPGEPDGAIATSRKRLSEE